MRAELESEFPREQAHLNDALCYCDMIRRAEPEILACTSRVLERVGAAKRQPM